MSVRAPVGTRSHIPPRGDLELLDPEDLQERIVRDRARLIRIQAAQYRKERLGSLTAPEKPKTLRPPTAADLKYMKPYHDLRKNAHPSRRTPPKLYPPTEEDLKKYTTKTPPLTRQQQMEEAARKAGVFAGGVRKAAQKGIGAAGAYIHKNQEFYRRRGGTTLDEDMQGIGSRFLSGMGQTGGEQRRDLRDRTRRWDSDDETVRFLGGSRAEPPTEEEEDILRLQQELQKRPTRQEYMVVPGGMSLVPTGVQILAPAPMASVYAPEPMERAQPASTSILGAGLGALNSGLYFGREMAVPNRQERQMADIRQKISRRTNEAYGTKKGKCCPRTNIRIVNNNTPAPQAPPQMMVQAQPQMLVPTEQPREFDPAVDPPYRVLNASSQVFGGRGVKSASNTLWGSGLNL